MDLATAQTHLTESLAELSRARKVSTTAHGDRTVTRQRLVDLQLEVKRWQRIVNQLTALAAGNSAPGQRTAKWSKVR